MFQNIINKMSEIVPGLKVQGMSNEDFIDFSEKIGVNKEYNSPTFIVGDTIFYNHEATFLTKDMAIEESLHPIVNGIKNSNPELFKDLFNEAKQNYTPLGDNTRVGIKRMKTAMKTVKKQQKINAKNGIAESPNIMNAFDKTGVTEDQMQQQNPSVKSHGTKLLKEKAKAIIKKSEEATMKFFTVNFSYMLINISTKAPANIVNAGIK